MSASTLSSPAQPTGVDKLLADATILLINFQDTLDNDQILDFIKLIKKVPTGFNPKSKEDVDKLTKVIYKEMPTNWPKDLKKSCVDTLNKIRATFDLPLFKNNNLFLIMALIALFVILIIGGFFLFKSGQTLQQAYSTPATGLPTQPPG
jgi:hypothetical protein